MRVFAISDLHVDYSPNRQWVKGISEHDYTDDILVLAGDISDKTSLLDETFSKLASAFKRVMFVPGNHDLWVGQKSEETSLSKFLTVLEMAQGHGIETSPFEEQRIAFHPLFSWYDYSFGDCSDYLQTRWMDFFLCHWGKAYEKYPPYGEREEKITSYFLGLNALAMFDGVIQTITCTHFLPRIDVMPDYIPEIHQRLYPILGSHRIDEQVRALQSDIHVYGHSHVNRDEHIDGIRYVNNAYGGPGESRIAQKALKCIYTL